PPQSQPPAPQQNPPSNAPQQPGADQQAPDKSSEKNQEKNSENPPEKKVEGANPVQVVEDKTKEVAVATKDAAAAGLHKARDWETGLVAGTYVRRNRQLTPLTIRQREDIYLQQTLTTPAAYMKRMFGAVIDQARDAPPQWGGGWRGYGERFASREGQFITANSLAALGNAKLGYEVRYDECHCSGFWPRARHAIARNFYTYNRTEKEKRPQLALYGGAFGAGMVSAAWKPGHDVLNQGGRGILGQAVWGTVLNVFIEFAPDINRKIGAKK
ncbi:MAG: hypothetical protein WB562_08485, partial [Candidatus Sulfotelmatobacter sp.]